MKYTKAQIIDALVHEWELLCHDEEFPAFDLTPEEYGKEMESFTIEELIEDILTTTVYWLNWSGDEDITLDEFMEIYG